MAKKKVVQKQKKRKKKWYPILAPQQFNNKILGETLIYEADEMMSKTIKANLMTIVGDMKRQHTNVSFEVIKVTDGKGYTQITGANILPTSVKRLIRKGRSKIEDSFIVKTKDGKYVRVKPLLVTNSNTFKGISSRIRITAKRLIQNLAHDMTYDAFVSDYFSLKTQKFVRESLSTIYPIKTSEIRMFELLKKEPKKFEFKAEKITDIIPEKKKKDETKTNKKEEESSSEKKD